MLVSREEHNHKATIPVHYEAASIELSKDDRTSITIAAKPENSQSLSL